TNKRIERPDPWAGFSDNRHFRVIFFDIEENIITRIELPRTQFKTRAGNGAFYYEFDLIWLPFMVLKDATRIEIVRKRK
ncbi:MAG: hypothetical protein AAF361_13950, partial [Bacteroidota bacterium]